MKRLAITQRVVENNRYPERRDALAQDWPVWLGEALPDVVCIPVPNMLPDLGSWMDAMGPECVILSGGNNWGEASERDRTEAGLIVYCRQNALPILGVCRGLHAINTTLGGSLTDNLEAEVGAGHVSQTHRVEITEGVFVELAGSDRIMVNSYHNQGVLEAQLATGLHAFAVADAGVVEGVAHENEPILAIQWHPEREDPSASFSRRLISTFFSQGAFWIAQ